jgi:hypothetical protein
MPEATPTPELRPVVDLEAHPELEPDLGPTKESIERGFEPDDAIGRDGLTAAERAAEPIIEPPAWDDELDTAYGAAEAQRAFADAFARTREAEAETELEL